MDTTDPTQALDIRRQLAGDPHRPAYHFQPPANWMNDPNGLIHWRGQYHLFYQHHPYGPLHANMHWGHAVSDDLVHWRDLPIALTPTPGGPDAGGCWSGCAVDHNGTPMLVYTGVWPEAQCLAVGSADMVRWKKHEANPVIPAPPEGLDVVGFRDPCVWRERDGWYAVIGSGIKDVGGAALLYRSDDLVRWEYLHPLCLGDKDETGVMWECPSFFSLGEKHVLAVSVIPLAYVVVFVGAYRNHRFEPEYRAPLDHSGLFYAPQSFSDASGRRLMFGWVREARRDALVEAAGWAGMQSIPRVLSLRADGRLGVEPAPELKALRRQSTSFGEQKLTPEMASLLPGVGGRTLEIIAEFAPGSAAEYGLKLCASPDGEEQTLIGYDRASQTLTVDRSRSCASPEGIDLTPQVGRVALAEGEALRLHVFLDGSVIEVFANERECLTTRVYPARPDSAGVGVFARGGEAALKRMEVWQLASIWDVARG